MRLGLWEKMVIEGGRTNFSSERSVFVGNTYFEHKSLHKYIRVAIRCIGSNEQDRSVLLKKDRRFYVQDVRGMEQDFSDHHVAFCKVR